MLALRHGAFVRPSGMTFRTATVISSFAVGCFMQGGFYQGGLAAVMGLIVCAAMLTTWRGTWDRTDRGLAVAAVLLSAWAGLRGSWLDALPTMAIVLSFTAMFLVARRLAHDERRTTAAGVVLVGLVLAVAGCAGVALHRGPWAAVEGPYWRSMAGTTYWNATAAILVVIAVVVLTWFTGRPSGPIPAVTAALLLAGAAATLSRGGALAAAAGLAGIAALGGASALRALLPPALGAGVIMLGLVPAMPVSAAPNPAAAMSGAALGLWTTVQPTPALTKASPRRILLTALAAVLTLALVVLPPLAGRVTVASPRWGTWQAAWAQVMDHPWTGVGAGQLAVVWCDSSGVTHATTLVHNEWLQLLAELGAVGFSLVAAMGVFVLQALVGGLHSGDRLAARAGLAAVTALMIASTFDFLWHLIPIPVLAGLILGCAVPSAPQQARRDSPDPQVVPVPEPVRQ